VAGDAVTWQIEHQCPQCGAPVSLEETDHLLTCTSAWTCPENSLDKLEFAVLPSREELVTYLPFWRVRARIEGIKLETEADLMRLANLPGTRITPMESLLVCQPFMIRRSELVHETLNLTVDRQTLAYGSQL
jgi:hypothetical protein